MKSIDLKTIYKNYVGFYRSSKARNIYLKSIYSGLDFDKKIDGEIEYLKKWNSYGFKINPFFYRLYSTLSGINNIDFVPDVLYATVILPKLNPSEYSFIFSDKNFYDVIFQNKNKPFTLFRSVDNGILDANFSKVFDFDVQLKNLDIQKLIIKPTIDTTGGKNIKVFTKTDSGYQCSKGAYLSKHFLERYYPNQFLIQEFVTQHKFLQDFNPTSLNTLRVLIYRSFKDEEWKLVSMALRVGGKNSQVDNLNGGGFVVGINSNHYLNDYAINLKGERSNDLSGINLKSIIKFPFYEKVESFSKEIGKLNPFQRFLGLDIAIDYDGNPMIIEVNNGFIGNDLPHLLGVSVFGEYCDEIISYTLL